MIIFPPLIWNEISKFEMSFSPKFLKVIVIFSLSDKLPVSGESIDVIPPSIANVSKAG